MKHIVNIIATLAVVACVSVAMSQSIYAPAQPIQGTVRFYVERNAFSINTRVTEGAALLKQMGWKVVRTWDRVDAQIFISADSDVCNRGKIATTFSCGDIRVCEPHAQLTSVAIAHEISHALGVSHIPSGVLGIMSPTFAKMTPYFTYADLAKFQSRTNQGSIWAHDFDGSPLCH
jgi:hypothetical protein